MCPGLCFSAYGARDGARDSREDCEYRKLPFWRRGAGGRRGEAITHVMSIRAKLEEKIIRAWEEKGSEGTVSSWWSAWASF